MRCPMDFEWVDIGKVPDYWQAIRSVLQGEVRQVGIPGKGGAVQGSYAGLNVAANWDQDSMCRARFMWAE